MFNFFTLEIEFIKNKIYLFIYLLQIWNELHYEMIYDKIIVPLNLKTLDFHLLPKYNFF